MARHIYACPLRWSDMDAFGHVNNVVFLRYLEEARIDFMFTQAAAAGAGEFAGGSGGGGRAGAPKSPCVGRRRAGGLLSKREKKNGTAAT
ncbi:acyl-CoA thioesterase, partial [Kitasatospora sp. NPDC059722]|uniref:acyl-CoA thioesterase n=1 Tax=Kitasatospora sp. NPDC059722 TaxID=3346925 RepID=UPI0036CDEB0B